MGKAKTQETSFRWFTEHCKNKLMEDISNTDEPSHPMSVIALTPDGKTNVVIGAFGGNEEKQFFMNYLSTLFVMIEPLGFCINTEIWISKQDNKDERIEPRLDPERRHGFVQYVRYGENAHTRMFENNDGKLEEQGGELVSSLFDRLYEDYKMKLKLKPPYLGALDFDKAIELLERHAKEMKVSSLSL